MTKQIYFLLALSNFWLFSQLVCFAQSQDALIKSSPVPKFSLEASILDKFQLGSQIEDNLSNNSLAEQSKILQGYSQISKEDRPNSYMEEYQVNWVPWMTKFAACWQNNLRYYENFYDLQFHTQRAAQIQFTCYADGHIGNIIIRQSSGIPIYDRLQIAALLQSAPLLPFPKGTERSSITLIQGWESHKKLPGEQDFEPWSFASRYPKEKVSRWVAGR